MLELRTDQLLGFKIAWVILNDLLSRAGGSVLIPLSTRPFVFVEIVDMQLPDKVRRIHAALSEVAEHIFLGHLSPDEDRDSIQVLAEIITKLIAFGDRAEPPLQGDAAAIDGRCTILDLLDVGAQRADR